MAPWILLVIGLWVQSRMMSAYLRRPGASPGRGWLIGIPSVLVGGFAIHLSTPPPWMGKLAFLAAVALAIRIYELACLGFPEEESHA